MPSWFDAAFELSALPSLQSAFGETVVHRRADGTTANETGMWDEHDPEPTMDRGKGVMRRGVLTLAESVSVSVSDRFTVQDQLWTVVSVQSPGSGFVDVRLQRMEDEATAGRFRKRM